MRVYLDNCCVGRPFDDQAQPRIRLESEAVIIVLGNFQSGDWEWIASQALFDENQRNPDEKRRIATSSVLQFVTERVTLGERDMAAAQAFQEMGFGHYDSIHLVAARKARCDVLLSTDDAFVRRAQRIGLALGVLVANPLGWVKEMLKQ